MSDTHPKNLSFDNTEIAFSGMSNADLNRAFWLFSVINVNILVKVGPPITNFAMNIGLPIKSLIKQTIFKHFCGGESIAECEYRIQSLARYNIGTILDYSVEGEEKEDAFNHTMHETIRTISRAKHDPNIPFSVFKITGLARFALLEKLDKKEKLSVNEQSEYMRVIDRVDQICKAAYEADLCIFIDAEESWIQDSIDHLSLEMMRKYNQKKAIVYNTFQMYRHDKLAGLREFHAIISAENLFLGAKLVRGAYMEKERKRADDMNYPSPIQSSKAATDFDYNEALKFCVDHHRNISICAGTHNEESSLYLIKLMEEKNIDRKDPAIYFSQLLGMSDNLSFNLSDAGYNVAKYVPYGPVKAVLPYLFRRAQENTAIAGQMSRELGLIVQERKRRRRLKRL